MNLNSQAYQTYTQIFLDSIFLQFEVKVQNIVFILRSLPIFGGGCSTDNYSQRESSIAASIKQGS